MGWYGNYEHPDDVIKEKIQYARGEVEILDTKSTRNWGAVLYRTDVEHIDFFIFGDGMYKPMSWANRPNLIPSSWIKKVLPNASEYEKELYEEYQKEQRKKRNKPRLDDILRVGKTYLIWKEEIAKYSHKHKRSYVFEQDGEFVRFRNLQVDDIEEI